MTLTDEALKRINTPKIRLRLAQALGCTEQTVIRYINKRSDALTKAGALLIIREETGLSEGEILTTEIAQS